MFEERLVARLKTKAANVYPLKAPKDYQTPAVVWSILDTDSIDDLDGAQTEAYVTVQVAVYDPSFMNAKRLARVIRDDLKQWSTDMVEPMEWLDPVSDVDDTTAVQLYKEMFFIRFHAVIDT